MSTKQTPAANTVAMELSTAAPTDGAKSIIPTVSTCATMAVVAMLRRKSMVQRE